MTTRKKIIIILIITGFCAIEFPGIFLVMGKIEPFILGMPFLYGYVFCWWLYLCMVFFYAYKTGWGKRSFFRKENDR
ncbi:MAG: hypothetical protein ACOX4R_03115 [Lentihominibacter sp.]